MRNTLLLAAALLAAPAAMAEGLSYNYVDGRYFSSDSDALNANLHGGVLAASFAISPTFYVLADGQYAQSEKISTATGSGRFDSAAGSVRLGAHYAITSTLDIVGNVGGLYNEYKGKGAFKGNKDDGFGYLGEVGFRLALIPRVEVGAFYDYQDVLDETQGSFTADLQFHVTEHFSVVGAATNARSIDLYSIGARYYF